MRHTARISRPSPANTKGLDTEDFLIGGLIYCLLSGNCDFGDIKDVFGFLNRFF
jgi:hypothetical protein